MPRAWRSASGPPAWNRCRPDGWFDPGAITRTGKRLGLFTEARASWRGHPARRAAQFYAAARTLGITDIVAFAADSGDYAEPVRRIRWQASGLRGWLARYHLRQPGGAQVFVPRALGEAFGARSACRLPDGWTSSDGVPVELVPLD